MSFKWGDPIIVATLRGLYTALGMGALMWLTVYSTTDDSGAAWLAFGFAFLGALGFRGGVEGVIDQRRKDEAEHEPLPSIVISERFDGVSAPAIIGGTTFEVKDFDTDYHFVESGRHAGKLVDCADCRA